MYMTLLTFDSQVYCIIFQMMWFILSKAKIICDGYVTDIILQLDATLSALF